MLSGVHVGTLIALLGLGVTTGFSPTTYDVTLRVLERPDGRRRPVVQLCSGIAVGALVLLAVFRTFDPETVIALWRGRIEAVLVQAVTDVVAGVLLLVAAVVVHALRRRRRAPRTVAPAGGRRLFVLGFTGVAVSVSSVATAYGADRLLTAATHDPLDRVVGSALFVVGVVGPYVLAAVVWARTPALSRAVRAVHAWATRRDFRPVLVVALAVAGIVSIVVGVVRLAA